jgi:hypothetical protein
VNRCGASAGSVVCGAGLNNQGLRVKLLQEQVRGHDGGVLGGFVILDVGDNMHSPCLEALLHQETNAAEVLGIIRREHAGCVSIVNTNILISEEN